MKFYLVGGAVRDQLLQLPVKDLDWVVIGATPQAMLDQGFKQVGADFPVFLHPETKEEYALARQERKKGHGYKGFECFFSPDVSIEDDLLRRDLTINAMAQSENGEIIDPYNGQEDIANKKLRHVSDAFVEDPLRVLRVARFAARFHGLGFEVAEETNQLMRAIVSSGELDNLVPERVWQETQRALAEEHPEVFFEVLQTIGALKVLFPELENLNGVPQPEEHHPEIDTWLHVKLCLQQAVTLSASNTVRFAVLMHDLGKGVTPQSEWPRHIAHEEKGLKLVKQLCQRLRVPNDYKDLALMVCEFHTHSHRAQELKAQTVLKVLNRLDSHRKPQRFEDFLLACEIDAKGRTGLEHRPYPQREYLSEVANKIREIDIQALVKEGFTGPKLGEAIHKKRLEVINQVKDSFWQNQ